MQKEAGQNGALFTTTTQGSLFLEALTVQDLPTSDALLGLETCSVAWPHWKNKEFVDENNR